jgi:O-antigen/teichoic acid export membrane protein
MGMSLQIINALNAVAIAWVSTKVPLFGQLNNTKQRQLLDMLFFRALTQSFIFLFLSVLSVWGMFMFLNLMSSPYMERIIPLHLFTFLCLVCLANHIVFAEATYLRAHKIEPLIYISVSSAVLSFVLAFLTVPSFGLAGAVFSYTVVAIFISLLGSSYIFLVKRKQWRYH